METVTYTPRPGGGRVERATLATAGVPGAQVEVRTYDATDQLLETVVDEDADGAPEIRETWSWAASGEPLEVRREGAEGTAVRTWERRDQVVREVLDEDGDGIPDHATELHYRDDGQRVLKREEAGADGEVSWQKRYVYRPDGKRIFEERDVHVDGTPDQRWDYLYDADGVLAWEVRTEPGSAHCAGVRPE